MCYLQPVSFIEFPIDFCMLDETCVTTQNSYYQEVITI